jgi:hypothetical protein
MIYLYHIRRTGGRSLIFSILSQEGDPGDLYGQLCVSSQTINNKLIQGWERNPVENAYFAWSHEPMWKVTVPKDTFTITILRDPMERLVSHYRLLLIYKEMGYVNHLPGYEWKWLGRDLLEFSNNIALEHLQRQLYMFSQDFDIEQATERIKTLSYFFYLDNYTKALKGLGQMLGMGLREYRINEYFDPNVCSVKNLINTNLVQC